MENAYKMIVELVWKAYNLVINGDNRASAEVMFELEEASEEVGLTDREVMFPIENV